MKKAIILLSGDPQTKNKFISIVESMAWIWNINPKNKLRNNLKSNFYWKGDKTEEVEKFISDQLASYNELFDFEKSYLVDKIVAFNEDDSEIKVHEDKTFDKFVLVAHGVSKSLVPFLQEEYGVFKVHLSKREYHSNEKFNDVTVLYEDDENFVVEVNRIIEVLTH